MEKWKKTGYGGREELSELGQTIVDTEKGNGRFDKSMQV
jgi:hypothetical protein